MGLDNVIRGKKFPRSRSRRLTSARESCVCASRKAAAIGGTLTLHHYICQRGNGCRLAVRRSSQRTGELRLLTRLKAVLYKIGHSTGAGGVEQASRRCWGSLAIVITLATRSGALPARLARHGLQAASGSDVQVSGCLGRPQPLWKGKAPTQRPTPAEGAQ